MKLLLAAIVICALAPLAHADRADQLFKQGKKLLAEKKYLEACTAFEESDRLDPGIGTKLNVAKCYEEWGKLATAWRWYTDAEHMAQAAKDERAPRIHEVAAALDASVPRLTVILPRGVRADAVVVKLDGVALAAGALGSEQRVDPGPHQLDAIIDGSKQTKMVPIERGGSSEITLESPAAAIAKTGEPVGEPAEPAAVDPGRNRRYIGLGVSGAGVLAVGIAGIVVLSARGDYHDALSAHCNGASDQCDAEGLSATHSARHRANVATVVTLGGLAAVAGGAYLYFTAPRSPRGNEHALYLAPSVGGDATGVVLGGAF
jgi:tetratricopeptide (TPR) repeat protein